MKKRSAIDIVLLVFEILIAVVLVSALVYFSYKTVAVRITDAANAGTEGYFAGYGLMVFACTLIMIPVNLGAFVLSLVGFLIAKFNHGVLYPNKHRRWYLCLMIAPFVSQLVYSFVLPLILSWVL